MIVTEQEKKNRAKEITSSQSAILIFLNDLGKPLIFEYMDGWKPKRRWDVGDQEIKRSDKSRRFVRDFGSVFTGMENVELSITWMAAGEASA